MATGIAQAPARPGIDPRELVARAAIATTLAQHSRGIDRCDLATLSSAYHSGATVTYGFFEGRALDLAQYLVSAYSAMPVTIHRTSNMLTTVEGERARSESYVIAYLRDAAGDAPQQRLIGGRYLDRHECRDGAWRIVHRTYVLDWNVNLPTREAAAAMGPTGVSGAHGEQDRAHAMFAELRARSTTGDDVMGSEAIDEAVTKQALHDLVATYARAADRADEALLASVFHADADVVTGYIDGKAHDYARDVVAMTQANLASSFHSIGNEYYEVSGDHAAGESYVIAHALTGGADPQETLTGGRYLDRFERRDGHWKIAARTFVQDWTMTRPSTAQSDGLYEQLPTRGAFGTGDPSYAFWAA